jgi:hypothetical protein
MDGEKYCSLHGDLEPVGAKPTQCGVELGVIVYRRRGIQEARSESCVGAEKLQHLSTGPSHERCRVGSFLWSSHCLHTHASRPCEGALSASFRILVVAIIFLIMTNHFLS